ncbi:MAG: phosphoribosylanthranilate isomerase [Bacteroidales bacterium]|nr:phosphoribosylanthranilate isomerase [Bacteroidales bacterium]
MKVKVCGLKNRQNIREIVACKPDFLGFIFYRQSVRFVGEKFDSRLLRRIPPYINKVGVFVNENPDTIMRLVESYNLDFVQLHGDEDPASVAVIKAKRIGVIKSFRVDKNMDFVITEPYLPLCEYFLFDTRSELYGGTGEKFNWKVMEEFRYTKPFFLSGGILPEDIAAISALKHASLFAVDINSGFEISPGIKDVFKICEFIKDVKKI